MIWDIGYVLGMFLLNLYFVYLIGWLRHRAVIGKRMSKFLKSMHDEKAEAISQEEFVHRILDVYFSTEKQPVGIRIMEKIYDLFHKKLVTKKVEVKDGNK